MKKIANVAIISIAIIYLLICVLVYVFQTKLMFFPKNNNYSVPNNKNLLDTNIIANGATINAWFINNNSKKCVLFCHGNGGNISYLQARLPMFVTLHVNVLLFDYRGYGKSTGTIIKEQDLYNDAESALNFLHQLGIADSNIIIWGQSLGGSIATQIAQNKKLHRVILESTFTSMDAMGNAHYGWLPTTILSKFHFASIDKIKNIYTPIMILHSKQDEVINYTNGEQLFEKANEPKQFVTTKGFHNTAIMESYEQVIKVVGDFLK